MSGLDMTRLENVHIAAGKTVARCPACAETGRDKNGDHLFIGPDGRFGCVDNPGLEGEVHRKRIFALVGVPDKREANQTPPPKAPGRKGGKVHQALDAAARAALWSVEKDSDQKWRETRRDMYQNADGREVAGVLRFDRADGTTDPDGKVIKSFRPIHAVVGGWKLGDPPGKWTLFNLSAILARAGQVYGNEGEKAASAGAAIGLTCTTSAHGAKSPQKTDWSALAGRDVVILSDNDKAGRGYADKVAGLVHAAGAASIRILELPGLPPKGDLFDFVALRAGQSPEAIRAQIERLTASAPAWEPPAEEPAADDIPADTASDKIIVLPGGGVSITKCAENIFRKLAPTHELFVRGGVVMELRQDDTGGLRLDILRSQAFRSRIEKLGMLVAWRTGAESHPVLKPITCPTDTAEALLASEPAMLLPRVRGLAACPVLAEVDGQPRVLTKGYHSHNGGLLVTAGKMPPQMEVAQAVDALRLLVEEFDFTSPSDRSRALASFITPELSLGGWVRGHIPVDMAEADKSQSGKGFRQKETFAVYNEEPYRIAIRDGGVGGLDESIAQALITGRPFIQVDNVRGRMESQFIEMMATAGGCIGARVPHRGEVQVDSRHFLLFMTSNGVETTRDLANRASIIRIRKRTGYTFRQFPEGDILSHIQANQAYFLGAVFAVIRAWHAAGKPRTAEVRHDFREWAQTLDWIVQNILQEAPLIDGHSEAQERVSNPALTWLRRVALAVEADHRLDEEIMAGSIGELCEDHGIEIPGLRDAGDEGGRNKRVGILMKKAFGEAEEIAIDRYHVKRTETDHYYAASQEYKQVKTYVFTLADATSPEPPEQPEQPSELSKNTPHFSGIYSSVSGGSGNEGNTSQDDHIEDEERAAIQEEGSLMP